MGDIKAWTMPEWMRPYANLINQTGGNDIEELLNRTFPPGSNDVVAAMQISVMSQVRLLAGLRAAGLLRCTVTQLGGRSP